MAKAFDCATPLTAQTAANFKAQGYEIVARYLVPATSAWKALTADEATIIQAAGLKIVSVYETTADRSLSGGDGGAADAKVAMEVAKQVGQPTGSTIYFAVDFDPTDAQIQTVISYFKGINSVIDGYDVGVYGSDAVVNAVKSAGQASHTWQTYAWSNHQLSDCNIYQYLNGPDGADYDLDRTFGFEGAWGSGAVTDTVAPTAVLDPGVVQTVINTWIAKSFDATTNIDQKKYYNWLANQLRAAAGEPLEVYNG